MYKFHEISKKDFNEPFDVCGRWTFPGCEEELHGRLIRNRNGDMELNIVYSSSDPSTCVQIKQAIFDREFPRVTGMLETFEIVTLVSLFPRDMSSGRSEYEKAMFMVSFTVMGITLVGRESYPVKQMWEKILIPYTMLYEWLGVNPLSFDASDYTSGSFTMKYTHPKPISVNVQDGYSIRLSVPFPKIDSGRNLYEPDESAVLEVISSKPVSFNELYKQAVIFRDFLIFITGSKIRPKRIELAHDKVVVTAFPPIHTYEHITDKKNPEMKFKYLGIKNEFPDIINEWFRIRRKYERALDNFFESLLGTDDVDIADRFFKAARVLERIAKIKNEEAQPHSCIRPKKEKRQREMFKELFESMGRLLTTPSSKFVENVVNYRNDYAHEEPLVLKHEEISNFAKDVERLVLIINACIVNEMDCDVISDELKKRLFEGLRANRVSF